MRTKLIAHRYLVLATGFFVCLAVFIALAVGVSKTQAHNPLAIGRAACHTQTLANPDGGSVYYISPKGNNRNIGTSPCAPWQTLTWGNHKTFAPGSIIAFQSQQIFHSTLPIVSENGTAASPITYSSYGGGRARLTNGVVLKSSNYIDITDLDISSATTPALFSSPGENETGENKGTDNTNIVIADDKIGDTYDRQVGGFGIALDSNLDTGWIIKDNRIVNTADSGVFGEAGAVVEDNVFADNGIGQHCGWGASGPPATSQNHPCHGVYAKSGGWIISDNSFAYDSVTTPYSAISLRGPGNLIEDNVFNTAGGSSAAIEFDEESLLAGTTQITDNDIKGASASGIQICAVCGTEPLIENFVITDNTIDGPSDYDLYTSKAATITGNDFKAERTSKGAEAYITLTMVISPTSVYSEDDNSFSGSANPTPFYINGIGLTQAAYACRLALSPCAINPTASTSGQAPISLKRPSISTKGEILRAAIGHWKGAAFISYSYQWQARARKSKHPFKNVFGDTTSALDTQELVAPTSVRVCVLANDESGQRSRCSVAITIKPRK